MKYFFIDGSYIPKHCIYGPRPREAVFFNDWEWYRINDNLHRWSREKQAAELSIAKEQNKKELSLNMTKNWQNTLASVKTQSEQRRIDKRQKDKQDKIDQYNTILENRKEEKKPILASAKRLLFEAKDTTRMLVSALAQCEVITEREKQVEFRNFLKEEQAKKHALYVENMKKDVEEFRKEEQEERIRKLEAKKKFKNDLLEQAEEKRKRIAENELKERKAMEQDLVKIGEINEALKKCEEKGKLDSIKRTRMDYEKGYHASELEKCKAIEEDEENELNGMILKYAKKLEKERALKETNMIEETVKNREKITEALSKKLEAGKGKEEEIYEKAVREIEENYQKEEREKEELKKKSKLETDKWEEEHRERVAAENLIRQETLKWTIMQNARKTEIDEAWAEGLKRKARQAKENTREAYGKQIEEQKERAEETRKWDSVFLPRRDEDIDDAMKYCEDALEFAKKHEFKNYPLLATVAKVQESFGASPGRENQDKISKSKMQNKRATGSIGHICYCLKN